MKLSTIVKRNKSNIAFIVGNGINRFNSNRNSNSWDQLLLKLWNQYSNNFESSVPSGISLTEFYDVLELKKGKQTKSSSLQKEFCKLMEGWRPSAHHKAFINWSIDNRSPILTTNFENNLGIAGDCKLNRFSKYKFTDYYPWDNYYSREKIIDPDRSFAIWHINGMQRYSRSIRLGLSHYMGSVERCRTWLYKNERKLFSGNNFNSWRGRNTWLHIIFHKPIVIFGLELGQTEVFLRWLLIERAKYYSNFPEQRQKAWYIYTNKSPSAGKIMFLKNIGITPVLAENYQEIYREPWTCS